MNYFTINNTIFEYELSPAELMTFCAISSIKNCLNYAVIRAEAIANRTGLSSRAVFRAIEGLQDKGLISMRKRYRYDGYRAANGYTVTPAAGGKFKVDRRIWKHKLDASAFVVYLYLVKAANNHTKQAHPCLRKISDALNLCRNTVIAKVRLLQERMLIVKENRISDLTNRFISNEHTLLDISAGFICPLPKRLKAKKKERIAVRPFKVLHSIRLTISKFCSRNPPIFSLAWFVKLCKEKKPYKRNFTYSSHFFDSGGSYLAQQVLYPPRLQQKNE